MSWWAAVLVGLTLAGGGLALGWLTAGAALTAAALAVVVLLGTGPRGLAPLAVFFVSGSLLTRGRSGVAGARRRVVQVAANGWTAAVGAGLTPIAPDLGWAVLAGGLAAAQADTWATEIGLGARRPPRLITSGRPVAAGTSGGVTWRGSAGGALGSLVLAATVFLVRHDGRMATLAAAAGVLGMVADSVLGATVQGRWRWMTNDTVNAFGSAVGATCAVLGVAGGVGR